MSESGGSANVYEAMPTVRPEAIVLHCSDPRFQTAFAPFIENELGLAKGRYVPFVVAGGAGVLANPERRPKEFKFLKDRFELFHGQFASLRRLVLINHEDCAYYRMLAQAVPGLHGHGPDSPHWPRDDLPPIAGPFTGSSAISAGTSSSTTPASPPPTAPKWHSTACPSDPSRPR
jgi:hypothetical protein